MKIKVAADKAALLAHKAALKQKHALEMEKAALNMWLETVNWESDLAANNAKLMVFRGLWNNCKPKYTVQVRSIISQQSYDLRTLPKEEMNGYLEKYGAENS